MEKEKKMEIIKKRQTIRKIVQFVSFTVFAGLLVYFMFMFFNAQSELERVIYSIAIVVLIISREVRDLYHKIEVLRNDMDLQTKGLHDSIVWTDEKVGVFAKKVREKVKLDD
jgi:ABC-type uncharacterized transport system permease subunit